MTSTSSAAASRNASRQRGFTLIELLVVVSIICILMSLIFPVVGMVRSQARSLNCQSNLRQVALAYVAYSLDNRGQMPNDNLGNNHNQPNPAMLDTYIPPAQRVWKCTEYKRMNDPAGIGGFRYYVHWELHQINCFTWLYPGRNAVNVAWLRSASEAYIMGDLNDAAAGGYHRDRSNAAMMDGHVLNRSDLSMKIPYSDVVSWADPGQTMWNEHGATGYKGLKGYNY